MIHAIQPNTYQKNSKDVVKRDRHFNVSDNSLTPDELRKLADDNGSVFVFFNRSKFLGVAAPARWKINECYCRVASQLAAGQIHAIIPKRKNHHA